MSLIVRTLIVSILLVQSAIAQTEWTPLASIGTLDSDFSHRLAFPQTYGENVRAQAWTFPEGDLFPIVFPLMAQVNLAMMEPSSKSERRETVAILSRMAIDVLENRLGRKVEEIDEANGEATYIGQVNLALSAFRLLGGDDRFENQNRHLSGILHRAVAERHGAPIESWPGLLWPFDTLPAVLSLRVRDVALGTRDHGQLIRTYLEWMDDNGRDAGTGLPASQLDPESLDFLAESRGCDLSYRIALLSLLDKNRAMKLYDTYIEQHWLERGTWAGFAEYAGGKPGRVDADSGPVFDGLGLSATGFGLAATRAVGDHDRWSTLRAQADQLTFWIDKALSNGISPVIPPGVQLERGYTTGFLFGDAALYWAATFADWGVDLETPRSLAPNSKN